MWSTCNNHLVTVYYKPIDFTLLFPLFSITCSINHSRKRRQFCLLNEKNEFLFDLANNLICDHLSFEDVWLLHQTKCENALFELHLESCKCKQLTMRHFRGSAIEATPFTNIPSQFIFDFLSFSFLLVSMIRLIVIASLMTQMIITSFFIGDSML